MHPIQVEVLNRADWWLPWLPVVGSSLVSIAALITLFFTVRENRKALEHSEQREWKQWRREKLTEYCEQVLDTGQQVIGSFRGCVWWSHGDFYRNFIEQTNRAGTLSNVYRKLELIVGDQLDEVAKRNYNTLADLFDRARHEWELKSEEGYKPGDGLDRLDPACKAATEALREFASATRRVMGDSSTEGSRPPDREPEPPPGD